MSHRDVEPPGLREVAHTALIEKPSVFQHKRLAYLASPVPDGPSNGRRNRPLSVGHREAAAVLGFGNGVKVRAVPKGHGGIGLKDLGLHWRLQGLGHGSAKIALRLLGVAARAGLIANVTSSRWSNGGLPIQSGKIAWNP